MSRPNTYPRFIYILECPISGAVVYVGSTQNLFNRLITHVNRPSDSLRPWIEQLRKRCLSPIMTQIDCSGELSAVDLEAYWIRQFEAWGYKLFNVSGTASGPTKRKGKGSQYPNVTIPRETMAKWAAAYRWGDGKKIAAACGFSAVKVSSALRTGRCARHTFEALQTYFSKIAA